MKAICQAERCITEIEVTMCCSGADCGCLGMPTEPPLCQKHYIEWEKSSLPFTEFINKDKKI